MRFSRTSVALTAALSAIVAACDPSTRTLGPDGLPTSAQLDHGVTATGGSCIAGASTLVISVSRKEIEVGGESILYASLLDASGESLPSGSVVWAVGDPAVANQYVESSGHAAVSGLKSGTTTVTATCGSFAETTSITVAGGAPTDSTKGGMTVQVTLSASELNAGQTTQAVFHLKDAAGNVVAASSADWSSSDGSVASVNDDGLVTGVATGTTQISANVNGISGSANLSVAGSNTPTQPTPPTNVDPGSGVTATTPELPRSSVDARYVSPTGRTINVPSGGDLQGAINSANRGDVLLLAPGATYFGPITLPAKAGSGWITIRTAASDGALPSEGQRMTPAYASQLPKIVGGGANAAVLLTSAGASGYRVMGVEITAGSSIVNLTSLVELGEGGGFYQRSLSDVASDLVLDRVYVHGLSTTNLQR